MLVHTQIYVKLNYIQLLDSYCAITDINHNMTKAVEEATRDQNQSTLWYKYRAGRVTASGMNAVCHTKPAYPASSAFVILIKV